MTTYFDKPLDAEVSSLNSKITNQFKRESTLIMCNDASNTEIAKAATSVSGYKPIAIVGYIPYAGFASTSDINSLYLAANGTIHISWASAHSTAIGVNVQVLYEKE